MKRAADVLVASAVVGLAMSCGSRTSVELPAYGEPDAEPGDAGSSSSGGSSSGGGSSSSGGGSTPDSGSIDATVCPAPNVVCTGACVDLQTDTANCGGCGIACGGTCAGGRCIVELSSIGGRGAIAVDATSVYWVFYQSLPDQGIMKVPIGGGATTTLAVTQGAAVGVAVDATSVYFTEQDIGPNSLPGAVVQMPLQGGAQTTLASYVDPGAIAVGVPGVVWVETSWIVGEPTGGGAPFTLAADPSPYPVVCDTTGFAGLALSPTSVVWTTWDVMGPSASTLYATPLDGGTSLEVATASSIEALAADSTSVYWTENDPTATPQIGAVMKAPLTGGTPVTLASALPAGGGLAVDPAYVYYPSVNTSCSQFPCSLLMKVPIGGGTPVTLAVEGEVSGIAVDATSVYFTSDVGVYKVTPK